MKKGIIGIVVVAVLAIWAYSGYNGLVVKDEAVANKWAAVEADYQRRADLIPNLVATVKGYAEHESSTLQGVTEARTKATSVQMNVDELTEENLKAYQQAQSEVSSALGRLIAVAESYPDLKANENFRDLQVQLEGRIAFRCRARSLTMRCRPTMSLFVVSRRICWRRCLVSIARLRSRLTRVQRRLRRLNFNN